jgi:hypothetical protein
LQGVENIRVNLSELVKYPEGSLKGQKSPNVVGVIEAPE